MNVAIVGIGRWGKNLLKEFDKKNRVVMCVSSGNKENLAWVNRNYPNVICTSDLNEVLNNDAISIVVIATPIKTHYEIVAKCLMANKHVFVEKPTVTSIKEFEVLFDLARNKKKVLFTGYVYLYDDNYRFLKKTINVSDIREITFKWEKMGSFQESIFWNLLCHDISLCIDLIGVPDDVKLIKNEGSKSESDNILLELYYSKLYSVNISINRESKNKSKKISIVTKNSIYIWENNVIYRVKNGVATQISKPVKTALENEITEFLQLAQNGNFIYDTISKNTIEVIDKISTS